MGRLKGGHSLLTRNRGKLVEKLVETVASLKIVDQIPERYPRSDKCWRSAENVGIAVNDLRA
jgi:hypothetical protein